MKIELDRAPKIAVVLLLSLFLKGCGHPPDTDVTASPEYNFASFKGTVWKAKVKVALADLKGDQYLLSPQGFDRADPKFTPPPVSKVLAVLPAGTRLRIERLMKSNGNWDGVRVTATIDDGTYKQTVVFLDPLLLNKNMFLWKEPSYPQTWGVNSDMLEK